MRDIFTGLYSKIVGFFTNVEQQQSDESKNVARNRLKLVLMQDRTNLNPALLERLRGEIIDLLSRYVIIDKELLDLSFAPEDDQLALMMSIPVVRAKSEEEIEATLKAEDEAKKELEEKLKALEEKENAEAEKSEDADSDEETETEEKEETSDEEVEKTEDSEEVKEEEHVCTCGKENCDCKCEHEEPVEEKTEEKVEEVSEVKEEKAQPKKKKSKNK